MLYLRHLGSHSAVKRQQAYIRRPRSRLASRVQHVRPHDLCISAPAFVHKEMKTLIFYKSDMEIKRQHLFKVPRKGSKNEDAEIL